MGVDIDRNAPVVGDAEIEIAADAEIVWDVLTDVEGWPLWNPDVKSVALEGEVAEGTEFRWKTGLGHDHVADPAPRAPPARGLDGPRLRDRRDPRVAS